MPDENTVIRSRLSGYFETWLKKRLPRSREIELNQKRIFIFPSSIGWLFVVLMILLFVTSINYQNNLLLSLTCLFVSLFVTSILATYQNLSGLVIRVLPSDNVFSGESASLHMQLDTSRTNAKYAIYAGFKGGSNSVVNTVNGKQSVFLDIKTNRRGYFEAPRISFYSYYPLGLLRCWTWVPLDFSVWVYPKVRQHEFLSSDFASEGDNTSQSILPNKKTLSGSDDFEGLNSYRQGDSLKRIAWRHYAKTNVLLSKEFSSQTVSGQFLDWYALEDFNAEQRLEILCGWVLDFDKKQQPYGLRLPACIIEKGEGFLHKQACLLALAQYGISVPQSMGENAELMEETHE